MDEEQIAELHQSAKGLESLFQDGDHPSRILNIDILGRPAKMSPFLTACCAAIASGHSHDEVDPETLIRVLKLEFPEI
jgi:hypothetical protein